MVLHVTWLLVRKAMWSYHNDPSHQHKKLRYFRKYKSSVATGNTRENSYTATLTVNTCQQYHCNPRSTTPTLLPGDIVVQI